MVLACLFLHRYFDCLPLFIILQKVVFFDSEHPVYELACVFSALRVVLFL